MPLIETPNYRNEDDDDMIERLAADVPFIRDKLATIESRTFERDGKWLATQREIEKLDDRIKGLQHRHLHMSLNLPPDATARDRAEVERAGLKAMDAKRKRERLRKTQAENPVPHVTMDRVLDDLRLYPKHARLRDARVKVTLKKDESPLDAIATLTAETKRFVDERRSAEKRICNGDEADAALVQFVDKLAEDGAPNLQRLVVAKPLHGVRDIQWAGRRVDLGNHAEHFDNAVALIAWAFKDQLVEKLRAAMRETYPMQDGLSAGARRKNLAELDASILLNERRCEAYAEIAEAHGLKPPRTWSVEAVLGIARADDLASDDDNVDFG